MDCPVYDLASGRRSRWAVHVVYDEDNAAHRDAAFCGMSPGELGGGDLVPQRPESQPSDSSARYVNSGLPKMRVET
jgi:hypothetical protein